MRRRLGWIVLAAGLGVVALFGSLSLLEWPWLIGYGICSQIPEHSYYIAGKQLPLSARCTGTYMGTLGALVMLLALGRVRAAAFPPARVLAVLIIFILAMVVDGANSYLASIPGRLHLYEPRNLVRLVTGTIHGLALAVLVLPIFNFILWQEPGRRRPIDGFRDLALLVGVELGLVVGLVSSQKPFLLYPLAMASILGALAMLALLNATVLVVLVRREGRAKRWEDALLPLAGGLLLAVLEVGGLALLRAWVGQALIPI